MKESPAWLLNIGGGRIVCCGERELLHLVEQPELAEVPLAPRHCPRVLPWQGALLPVWDIHAWLASDSVTAQVPLVVIVGYQSRRRELPRFGAMVLAEPPIRTRVADSQGCPLPVDEPGWHDIALSCFMHQGSAVPILDLPRMFSRFTTPRS